MPHMAIILRTAVLLCLLGSAAQGETYPSRPIRLIVPYSAGSGADITADATQISFNFSASDGGFLVFQQTMNSGQTYWCVNSNNSTCNDNESVVPQGFMDPSAKFADRSGTLVIASAAGAVPEPATWALMLLGFAGLGYAGFRQSRTRAVPA